VWSAVPVQFLLVDFGGVGGGTVRIFFSFWPVRYGTIS